MKFIVFLFFFASSQLFYNTAELATKQMQTTPVDKNIILKLINKARKKGCQCGDTYYPPVPPLAWNEQLEQAAAAHSTDMFQKNYFGHSSQDGTKTGERIKKAGYNWLAYGENIGMGVTTEKEMIETWLKSAGHCKNIMSNEYSEMGVARTGTYWTQTFGRR